ncbi:MAG: AMP-binding protein [Microthrixaceae bacterium]
MELSFPAICEAVAQRRPDDTALVFRDRSFTWQQVQDRTRRLAMVLLSAGLGPQGGNVGPHPVSALNPPESRVALYLLNGNEYLEGMLGSWKARCIPFNVNYRYVAAELRYLLEDSGAEAVIVA